MTQLARRTLLGAAAGLVVVFATRPAAAGPRSVAADAVDGYLAIGPDGTVTVYSGKADIGTGLRAVVRQVVAEELGVDPAGIVLIEGDTLLTPDQGATGGSTGTPVGAMQIRRAAATARERLLALAAARLGRPAAELEAVDGQVRPRAGGTGIGFAALLDGADFALTLDPAAPLKDPAAFRWIGRSLPRPDVPAKVTGRHVYVHDITIPGMLHGRVIRPPAIGATLVDVDESSVAAIPGVRVVRRHDFLGLVAANEWDAERAARTLKARWTATQTLAGSENLFDTVRTSRVAHEEVLRQAGDPAPLLAGGRVLAATYRWPVQSHGSIGPSCAVADVRADAATIWSASQATHAHRPLFARFLGLPAGQVRLIYVNGAGSYGTNGSDDAAADAALLSQAVGAPVRVQWSRADELGWDPKGPPQILDLRAALDATGAVRAWETVAFLPANTPGLRTVPLLAVDAAGLEQPRGMNSAMIQQNLDPPYAIEHIRAAVRWLDSTPLRPSNLRSPGKVGNVMAVEGFMDELAAAAGVDAVEYRLNQLEAPRGVAALKRAAAMLGWQTRPSPAPANPTAATLRGRGISYCHYKGAENFLAMGMEVTVERATGAIRVQRVVCVHECGMMVNPDGVRAQVEGGILQSLSRALFEAVSFDAAGVTSTDWASYPILTFPDVPALEIDLIDRPNEKALGAGEAACAPVAAALGNALFDATGVRLREAPFTAERMKAALAARAT
jgi:CO/xanthine dehydrogenase Mo-binding subunit